MSEFGDFTGEPMEGFEIDGAFQTLFELVLFVSVCGLVGAEGVLETAVDLVHLRLDGGGQLLVGELWSARCQG